MKKQIITAAVSVGLFAGLTLTASAAIGNANKIVCLGTAVNAREASIGSAMADFTLSTNSAYSARATALKNAYTKTSLADVKNTARTAWSDFTSSVKNARKKWRSARISAWTTFRAAAKNCKAPDSASDSSNAVFESSGQ